MHTMPDEKQSYPLRLLVQRTLFAYLGGTNGDVLSFVSCYLFVDPGQHLLLVGAVEAPGRGQRQQQRSSCSRYRLLCDVVKVRRYLALSHERYSCPLGGEERP